MCSSDLLDGKGEHLFLDEIEGGSGAILLIRKNWRKIRDLAGQLLTAAIDGRGSLFLVCSCTMRNSNLCPMIGKELHEYLISLGIGRLVDGDV